MKEALKERLEKRKMVRAMYMYGNSHCETQVFLYIHVVINLRTCMCHSFYCSITESSRKNSGSQSCRRATDRPARFHYYQSVVITSGA